MKSLFKIIVLLLCAALVSGAKYYKKENNIRIYHFIYTIPDSNVHIDPPYLWQVKTARYVGKARIDDNFNIQYEFFDQKDQERMDRFFRALKAKEESLSYLQVFNKEPKHISANQSIKKIFWQYLVTTKATYQDKNFWKVLEKAPLGGFGVGRYNIIKYKTGEKYFKNGWQEEIKKWDFKNAMANNCCLIWYPTTQGASYTNK